MLVLFGGVLVEEIVFIVCWLVELGVCIVGVLNDVVGLVFLVCLVGLWVVWVVMVCLV